MSTRAGNDTENTLKKALNGERIDSNEALQLYENGDFLDIMRVAREIRNRKTDPKRVSYTMFRIVNYTSYCDIQCSFCSFYNAPGTNKGYTLTPDEVVQKMRDVEKSGVNQIFLQGGVNPDLSIDYYEGVLHSLREEFGANMHIRAFSPVEIFYIAQKSGLSLEQTIRRLKEAGVNSVPGAGAEMLSDRMRTILSPQKLSVKDWVRVMELCHNEGLPGSANIVFGSDESPQEFIDHLSIIRELQDRTGGFLSFIPWTFQQQTNKFNIRTIPPHEFLKALGICRIFLDNIINIEMSVLVLGQVMGDIALHAGANDISSVVIEENVLRSFAPKTEEEAREFILQSGFIPVKRDFSYRVVE